MSEIKKLIERLCPDGVEWKTMKDLCILQRGKVYSKKYISDNVGDYPVYSSQTANNGILGKINSYDYDGNYLTWTTDGAYAGTIFYRTGKFSITNVCGLIKPKNKDINLRFLYYWLSLTAKKYVYQGMGNPKLMSNQVEEIEIPVPPIEVQSKIVEILDNFTELEAELEIKLEAELEARRKQYEYYRNQLLTFDKVGGTRFERLKDVFEMRNGYTPSKNNSSFWDNGIIPWFRMEDIRENGRLLSDSIQHIAPSAIKGKGLFKANSIILATSATIGEHALISVEHLSNQRFTNIYPKENFLEIIDMKFIFYYMFIIDEWCKQHTQQGSFASVDMNALYNLLVPIPPLEEQQRIVSILDRFEALTTDLQSGLPAEIEARRKQYEYYREQLLTFKRKTA